MLLLIQRWYSEMRGWRIFAGVDESQRCTIARDLLRGHIKVGELL